MITIKNALEKIRPVAIPPRDNMPPKIAANIAAITPKIAPNIPTITPKIAAPIPSNTPPRGMAINSMKGKNKIKISILIIIIYVKSQAIVKPNYLG